MTQRVIFTIDGHLPSRANQRGHWRNWAKVWKAQRTLAGVSATLAFDNCAPKPPLIVTMTRISPRLLDDDNLAAAFKSVRDGIADALGIDDRDPRITWKCEQAKGKPSRCEIAIERET